MDAGVFERNGEGAADGESFQGEKQKFLQEASLKDPKLLQLKEVLVSWINSTLKSKHIVVRRLEEDLFDGLVLRHLLSTLAGVRLSVEEIVLSSAAQIRKLGVILEELDKNLGLQAGRRTKWSVGLIHNKVILATMHLLVAMARRFQPELDLPPDVKVEVVVVEVSRDGIRSDVQTEVLTEVQTEERPLVTTGGDPIEQLLKLEAHKVDTVKQKMLHFVNQSLSTIGLQVVDMDKQFADGVILLLLIGQLEGFFIPLHNFNLTPLNSSEMLHNVTLALNLLGDTGLQVSRVKPQDIVSQDVAATMKVLYALFRKHHRRREEVQRQEEH